MSLRSSSGGFDTSAQHRGRVHGWLGVRPWVARGAVKVSVVDRSTSTSVPTRCGLRYKGKAAVADVASSANTGFEQAHANACGRAPHPNGGRVLARLVSPNGQPRCVHDRVAPCDMRPPIYAGHIDVILDDDVCDAVTDGLLELRSGGHESCCSASLRRRGRGFGIRNYALEMAEKRHGQPNYHGPHVDYEHSPMARANPFTPAAQLQTAAAHASVIP